MIHKIFVIAGCFVLILLCNRPVRSAETTAADIALRHLAEQRQALGLTEADIADVVVSDYYTSDHTGVTHVYLRQRYQGIEVFSGNCNINLAPDGTLLSLGSDMVPNLARP
ncbi:hypothetical protein L0156_23545 [bacterium]|nr:hypothetical protein [bacterium]